MYVHGRLLCRWLYGGRIGGCVRVRACARARVRACDVYHRLSTGSALALRLESGSHKSQDRVNNDRMCVETELGKQRENSERRVMRTRYAVTPRALDGRRGPISDIRYAAFDQSFDPSFDQSFDQSYDPPCDPLWALPCDP